MDLSVVGVQKLQYMVSKYSYADITGVMYVPLNETVIFNAVATPAGATYPDGLPAWSGTSGASSSGVTFLTASKSTSDFQTVTATCGDTSATLKVIVYDGSAPTFSPVTVIATGASFSPDINPVNTWVDATLSAKAKQPDPGMATLSSPAWSWTIVGASYSSESDSGPWSDGTSSGYVCSNVPASSKSPDGTYDYSAILLSASGAKGGYWQFSCNAEVFYTDTAKTNYTGAAFAQAKDTKVEVISITVTSGATDTDIVGPNNWVAVCGLIEGDKVATIEATLMPNSDEAAEIVTWTVGKDVTKGGRKRTVDLWLSKKTRFIADAGTSYKDLYVWAMWVTIEVKMTGKTPANAVQFGALYDGTENLGVKTYVSGGQTIAVGAVVPVATITPKGVNAIVKTGWKFGRDTFGHWFIDGDADPDNYNTKWEDDTSFAKYQKLTPDTDDRIYDRDAPNVVGSIAKTDFQRYDNFRQYVEWNNVKCSEYTAWYWKARRVVGADPEITVKELKLGAIDPLPTEAAP